MLNFHNLRLLPYINLSTNRIHILLAYGFDRIKFRNEFDFKALDRAN